ncbi:RagB/SusD family nutrient uptake outer membrane protein [Sabulilitoribacter arenilitoris]|uniref:RagB/SusD family nutrient uptake outer membrane protein n=1 Tax=Wocania arenilitoris TaxID=2044858 RepID=A0AAE3EPL0_9FLAO|nr:RagB/SusD family nutrient uptake outer membrane protein [Wocania arenilitoris]MCF7568232.1 RagB/SusD family nutrient uptake outer membrane protein [Wocania arenilitoris]
MKKIIYIICIAFLFTACQELDLSPEHTITDGFLWDKEQDYELAVNFLYNDLDGFRSDTNSDIAFANSPSDVSNGSRVAPQTSGFYNGSYADIRDANFIIDRASTNGFENSRWVAEARWFRALYYTRLVMAYGDVQFYTSVIDPADNDALFASRTSREVVVDFIIDELNAIRDLLPLQSQLPNSEYGRITKGAADALRARIALFEGTWIKYHGTTGDANQRFDEAIDASQAIMNSGEYSLFNYAPNPAQSYRYFFMEVGNDSPQQIVAKRFDRDRRHGHSSTARDRNSVTKKLADMYLCTDGLPIDVSPLFQGRALMDTEFENRDPRMAMTIITPGAFTIDRLDQTGAEADWPIIALDQTFYANYKFISEFYFEGTGSNTYYAHSFHFAEVLLINAEATFERNGSITDAQLNSSINLLRTRAGIAALTNSLVTTNGLDMLSEIRRERTIELAQEGYRRDDLRRWKTAEVEMPMALKGAQFVGTEFETAELSPGVLRYPSAPATDALGFVIVEPGSERNFTARDYLEPFPVEETIINTNLQQNPGW